jgi:hypothetical protein
VEEGIVDHGDGAVDLALDAVVELECLARLVAGGEGNPLNLVAGILDMLAGFSAIVQDKWLIRIMVGVRKESLTCYGSCIRR